MDVNRKETQDWLDTWATPIDLEAQDLHVMVSGDLAFWHGFLRMTGTKKGAEGKVDFWMRETLCFERKLEGSWRIVHEHTSVPFLHGWDAEAGIRSETVSSLEGEDANGEEGGI